jgi:hypothetical protein
MSFIGAKRSSNNNLVPVYDLVKILNERIYGDPLDVEDMGEPNPYYEPDADFNVASGNAKWIIEDLLGYKIEDGYVEMEIEDLERRIVEASSKLSSRKYYSERNYAMSFFVRTKKLIDFSQARGATHIYGA